MIPGTLQLKGTCYSLDTSPTLSLQGSSVPVTLYPLNDLYTCTGNSCFVVDANLNMSVNLNLGSRILMLEKLLFAPSCLCARKTDNFFKSPEFLQI